MSSQSPGIFGGSTIFVVGLEGRVVFSRSNKGNVGADKSDTEPEALVLVFFQKGGGFLCCLSIGMNEVVSVCFDNDESVSHRRRVFLPSGFPSRVSPSPFAFHSGTGAVVSLGHSSLHHLHRCSGRGCGRRRRIRLHRELPYGRFLLTRAA